MTTPKDGGLAFPWHQSPGNQDNLGLTKRDWFAGQALAGLLASEASEDGPYYGETRTDPNTGKVTYRQSVYPLDAHGREDYSKTMIPCPVRQTRYEHVTSEALAIADAMLAKREKEQP